MIYVRQSTQVVNKSLGFLSLLTLLFVAAKLFGAIDWSWWFVFIPLWIIPAIIVGTLTLGVVGWLVIQGWCAYDAKKRQRRRVRMSS